MFEKSYFIISTKRNKTRFDFKSIIASLEYHVCKETAWSNAKVNDKFKMEIETNLSLIAIDPNE